MKRILKSLRFHLLLPVVAMTVFIVVLLNSLFSIAYNKMILGQEQEVNAIGFETVSNAITPFIESSISKVRGILSDGRLVSCLKSDYNSDAERIRARRTCRNYLRGEIEWEYGIFGLLFMRKDGSLFGTMQEATLFLDNPEENPLPEKTKSMILNAPLGQTVWAGPVSGNDIYGFQTSNTPQNIMIASWKSVDVAYGECYAMVLIDESVFDRTFATLKNEKGTWHIYTESKTEIYHTGNDHDGNEAELLISKSNSGEIFTNEEGVPVMSFSMTMESPAWTLVREVAMEDYEKLINGMRDSTAILGFIVLAVGLGLYELWLKKFMRHFRILLKGITQMGQNDSEPITSTELSISEFVTMKQEINRTSLALNEHMGTIQRMTAEQERINTEMNLARDIQVSALPNEFPAFPDRDEFDLFASMTPAKEVGGDFYDFFLIDDDHLALVIADVSGKGIPAALFMMTAKAMIKNHLLAGCNPAQALERVNAQISKKNTTMTFVTVWLAVVEISTGKGLACNAGHENPALRRAGGEYELLVYPHNMLVGGLKKAHYQNREFELHPGDCLFVYTDGVLEASNPGKEMFGEKRLAEVLNRNADAEPEEIVRYVHDEVNRFADSADQFDDITMLCIRYNGGGKTEQKD